MLIKALNTPWKVRNEFCRWAVYPRVRLIFALNGISWGTGWRFYGVPFIQKHRGSIMTFGPNLQLRSSLRSNPLSPNHPVILCAWREDAALEIGENFGMTGGSICSAERIIIGDNVTVGANTTIMDTDFHPFDPIQRRSNKAYEKTAPIVIKNGVFIGMNCLILKGVSIGQGSVVGAGSVVTHDVPPNVIVAGNPAQVVRQL